MRIAMLLLATLLWMQCGRNTYTSVNFPETYLAFGSGGGITGQETTNYILDNGQIFKTEGVKKDKFPNKPISKKLAQTLLEEADALFAAHGEISAPENRYFFIKLRQDGQERTMVWGALNEELPEPVKAFYTRLKDSLKAQPAD